MNDNKLNPDLIQAIYTNLDLHVHKDQSKEPTETNNLYEHQSIDWGSCSGCGRHELSCRCGVENSIWYDDECDY